MSSGGPGARAAPTARRQTIERVLEGAALLGAELEPSFRVLSVTVEPAPGRVRPAGDDPRLLVVAHPVSTVLAVLIERVPGGPATVRTFETARLPDVTAALGGARLTGPLLGRPEPRPGAWAPRWSLEGRSTAADGTAETLTIRVQEGDLSLALFVRCDVVELRRADGTLVGDDPSGDAVSAHGAGRDPDGDPTGDPEGSGA